MKHSHRITRRTVPGAALASILCFLLIMFAATLVQAQKSNKSSKAQKLKREIAITFDELPAAESFSDVNVEQINDFILHALDTHQVKAAGFVVGSRIDDSYDLLGQWLNAGHVLGNLTYSHADLHALGAENFIHDINSGSDALETMLAGFGQKKRYFRYPFLHYGETVEEKRAVADYLEAQGVVVAHATVDDYLYNLSLEKMKGRPDSAAIHELIKEYIIHVSGEVSRCESLAQSILKRNCRQILLLRVNMLNALALDDLLTELEKMGYKFVTLDYALKDDVYSAPDAYFGARGVGYLDMIYNAEPDLLPAE